MEELFKMDLQYFAEPEGNPEPKGDSEENNSPKDDASDNKQPQKVEAKYTDEDVDKIVSKKFATQKSVIEELKAEIEELRTKSMSDEEAKTYRQKKAEQAEADRLKAIEEREKMLELKEGTLLARDELSKKGINRDFVHFLVETKEFDSLEDKLEAFADMYAQDLEKGVEAQVKQALSGSAPRVNTGNQSGLTKEKILSEPDQMKRQKLIRENLELFQ